LKGEARTPEVRVMEPSVLTPKAVFDHAHELRSPTERQAYLDQACADDPDLRTKVEALLRAYDEAGSFLESASLATRKTVERRVAEGPGSRIGPYKLLQELGEGGMGVVFMAEQEHPVRRRVALKVIKPGMDSAQVVARFEAERQALALMDHHNIAKVLDAGTTASGRPYFVMELVHGVPITKYCDDHHLTPRERLELFVPVCQAIQHAHQKGVIHRDVKPSNVMVCLYDGRPVPKVIDFGVAKATEQRLTERTLFTKYGTIIGTFEYMAPEQAEMSQLGVDTRSDIYSLGVLLYELLTGTTPLERAQLRQAALVEVLRLIREEEPPKPSTRITQSKESLADLAAQRKTEPAKLSRLLRGELDWIVMRALEKDRTRRYETATGLARDVQRYLADEAVEACPPSAGYRLRKFARKHRAALATVAGFAALLLLGAVVGTWQALRAERARELALVARDEAMAQRQAAEHQRDRAAQAEDRAQANAARAAHGAQVAQAVQDFLLYDLLAESGQSAKVRPELRAVLDLAAERVEGKFADQPLVEATIRYTIGDVYTGFGAFRQTADQVTRALDLLERSRPLSAKYESLVWECYYTLGEAFIGLGDYARAEPVLLRAENTPHYNPAGSHEFAAANVQLWLGVCRLHQGQFPDAETRLRIAVDRMDLGHWGRGQAKSLLGDALMGQRKYAEAEPLLLQGYERLKELEAGLPEYARRHVPEAVERLVQFYEATGKPEKAAEYRAKLPPKDAK
jgi:serine/threonine protein kinase/tetratricopeptide (TPR) repeat protein